MDALVLLAVRGGLVPKVTDTVNAEVARLLQRLPVGARVDVLTRLDDDPYGDHYAVRPYEVVVDVHAAGASAGAVIDAVGELAAALGELVASDLGGVVVGERRRHLDVDASGPVRVIALMRRRPGITTEQFQATFGGPFAAAACELPGVVRYDQLHPDPEASRRAAGAAGAGVWALDGVAVVHLDALADFTERAARSPAAARLAEQEPGFVDAANGVSFVCGAVGHERA